MSAEYNIIIGYVIFLSFIAFCVTVGAESILTNPPPAPSVPPAPGFDPLGTLIWVSENIGYFFSLMIATSIAYPWLAAIMIGYTVVFIYIVLGLIRGGH